MIHEYIVLERLNEVLAKNGKSRSAHYKDVLLGLWTRPIKIHGRAVAWPAHETSMLIAAVVAEQSADEIRKLVFDLHSQRRPSSVATLEVL